MVLELTTHVSTCAAKVQYKGDPVSYPHVAGLEFTTPNLACAVEVLYKRDPDSDPHVAGLDLTTPHSTVVVPDGFVDSNQP